MKYDYLIVGAGLYGAVCANLLANAGKKVLVIEKRNNIGGNIRTERINNIMVHMYGAHIFHTSDEEVWNYVCKFAAFNNFVNSPIAIYKDEVYNLPFNMNTFNKIWPDVITPEQAKARIEEEKTDYHIDNPKNLEEQAINLVGYTIYKKLVEGYTEKQWGKKCKDLPAFIIKRLPVRMTFNNNYFNDKYQGIPTCGYTEMIYRMLDHHNITHKIGVDYFVARQLLEKNCSNIIYTGKIDEFFNYKLGKLEYRSLRFEIEVLEMENYQGNAVVNYTSADVPYTRIIEHKHFNNDVSDCTVITKEYPEKWDETKEPYYPINDDRNNELYEKYKKEADRLKNVYFGGRLAEYKYYDMDKTVRSAMNLVKRITERGGK